MPSEPFPDSRFNDFLSAPIGPEGCESQRGLISELVGLGLDPLEEAACLSRLPRREAVRRLASLIAQLPEIGSAEPVAIAATLIDLLPPESGAARPWIAASGRLRRMMRNRSVR
jgi:hypothetical protein